MIKKEKKLEVEYQFYCLQMIFIVIRL